MSIQLTENCYFCDICLWFSRHFEPVWKWSFWWTELWIFCVAPQSVNCCCVQCDCCGLYGGDNKYNGCVLCTCDFLSSNDYIVMIFCLYTFRYFWIWYTKIAHTDIQTHKHTGMFIYLNKKCFFFILHYFLNFHKISHLNKSL